MSHPGKDYAIIAVKAEVVETLERTSKGHLCQGCTCAMWWHRGPGPVNEAACICHGPGDTAGMWNLVFFKAGWFSSIALLLGRSYLKLEQVACCLAHFESLTSIQFII